MQSISFKALFASSVKGQNKSSFHVSTCELSRPRMPNLTSCEVQKSISLLNSAPTGRISHLYIKGLIVSVSNVVK